MMNPAKELSLNAHVIEGYEYVKVPVKTPSMQSVLPIASSSQSPDKDCSKGSLLAQASVNSKDGGVLCVGTSPLSSVSLQTVSSEIKMIRGALAKGHGASFSIGRHRLTRRGSRLNEFSVTICAGQADWSTDGSGRLGAMLVVNDVVAASEFTTLSAIFDQFRLESLITAVMPVAAVLGTIGRVFDLDNTGSSSLAAGSLVTTVNRYPLRKRDSFKGNHIPIVPNTLHLQALSVNNSTEPAIMEIHFPVPKTGVQTLASSVMTALPGTWLNPNGGSSCIMSGMTYLAGMQATAYNPSTLVAAILSQYEVHWKFNH